MLEQSKEVGDRNVLVIAFHFPPQTGSSGLLRTLKFCRYLPDFGWNPTVLTTHVRAYESFDARGISTLPDGLPVIRALAWDTKKHFGFRGRYLGWMALPDRWVSWLVGAVPSGVLAIQRKRIEVIFSTFPIASAVLLGFVLHRLTGKPWVVDLRDSMTEEGYPRDPRTRRLWLWLERKSVQHADRIIFTAASTREMYLKRYPELTPSKCLLISNGYDEEDFAALHMSNGALLKSARPLRLLHTGLIYPEERDPRPFFRALARLKREGRIASNTLSIVFRAPGSEDLFQRLIDDLGIADLLQIQPHVPYRQALQECGDADGLLLFQAANCDHQIPAKSYEYLRLRKPIFALTTQIGDTAALLREVGGATIANLAEADDIYHKLPDFLAALSKGSHPLPDELRIRRYARRNQAEQLARCLFELKNQSVGTLMENTEALSR
jgi:glycosyltransferase involved in cell wall biosynthesis